MNYKLLSEKQSEYFKLAVKTIRAWHGMNIITQADEEITWNIYNHKSPEMKRLNQLESEIASLSSEKEGKSYEGSKFTKVNEQITLGCISHDAESLLDTIMEEWKLQGKSLKENNPKYEPSHYAFAYWLVRWSGLIKPSKTEEPTAMEMIKEVFEPIQLGENEIVNQALELASKKAGKLKKENLKIHLKDSIKNKTYQKRFKIACDFPQDEVDLMIDEAIDEYFVK